jgi:uncharacterized protein Smg (DUF494 family)
MVEKNKTVDILIELAPQLMAKKNVHSINTKKLEGMGYSKIEITYAISLLLNRNPKLLKKPKSKKILDNTFLRIMPKEEKTLFTKEAYQDILLLRTIGVIDEDDLNDIIERISVYFRDRVSRDELRQMINYMIDDEGEIDFETGVRLNLKKNDQIH